MTVFFLNTISTTRVREVSIVALLSGVTRTKRADISWHLNPFNRGIDIIFMLIHKALFRGILWIAQQDRPVYPFTIR